MRGTVLTAELSMGWSHIENTRITTIPKLYYLEEHPPTPRKLLTSSQRRACLYPVLIPAAVGILPRWLIVLVLKLSLLPPENWEGGTA